MPIPFLFMLGKITNLLNNALSLNEDKAWIFSVTQQTILDDVKSFVLAQLKEGEDEEGNIVGVYSQATQTITNGRKQAGQPYDFKDTGDFYASIFAVRNKDRIMVFANGQKDDENILDKYGLRIIGLNDAHKQELGEQIKNEYLQYVRNVLYKG